MKKNSLMTVIIIMLLLAVLIAVFAFLNGNRSIDAASDNLIVRDDKGVLAEFSLQDIEAMEFTELEKTIVSGSGNDETGLFRGVPLADIINAVSASDVKNVNVRAADGFVSSYSVDEVLAGENVLLVYSKDGEYLGTLDDGGTGPFRIVVADDAFGNRCAKYVNFIELS